MAQIGVGVAVRRESGVAAARAVLRWMLANPLATGAVLLFVFGTAAWTSMAAFYRQFGATPEEVGSAPLSQPVVAGIASGCFLFVCIGCGLYLLFLLGLAYWSSFRDTLTLITWVRTAPENPHAAVAQRRWLSFWATVRGLAWLVVATAAVIGLFALFVALPGQAQKAGQDVIRGQPTLGMAAGEVSILSYRAVPVRVTRIGGASPVTGDCVMLLGSNNGTTVLYDVSHSATLRKPAATVDASTDDNAAAQCDRLASRTARATPGSWDLHIPLAIVVGVIGAALFAAGSTLLNVMTRTPSLRRGRTAVNFVRTDMSIGVGLMALAVAFGTGIALISPIGYVLAAFLIVSHLVLFLTYQVAVEPARI
jgi:hypothetical protein